VSMLMSQTWKGPRRGDMLGTAFYHDSGYHYIIHKADGSKGEEKEARNAFWIRVLSLVPWQPEETRGNSKSPQDHESNRDPKDKPRNLRPIFVLTLSMEDSASANNDPPLVDGDVDLKFRHWLGVVASEIMTLIFGIVTAAVWKSPFSAWYFAPLASQNYRHLGLCGTRVTRAGKAKKPKNHTSAASPAAASPTEASPTEAGTQCADVVRSCRYFQGLRSNRGTFRAGFSFLSPLRSPETESCSRSHLDAYNFCIHSCISRWTAGFHLCASRYLMGMDWISSLHRPDCHAAVSFRCMGWNERCNERAMDCQGAIS
jgi:hypothetical protein